MHGRPLRTPSWTGMLGGGMLFRGDRFSSYIYPDLEMALVGNFAEDGTMLSAVEGRLVGVTCNERWGVLEPVVQVVEGKEADTYRRGGEKENGAVLRYTYYN